MSATSYFIADALNYHGVHLRAGVKKTVKKGLSRAQRNKSKTELAGEVSSLRSGDLHQVRLLDRHVNSQAALDEYASWLLQSAPVESSDDYYDYDEEPRLSENEESLEIPLYLQGALPDWMLNELEAANGDAFNVLSMFEAKRPSPKAAFDISVADEALYA